MSKKTNMSNKILEKNRIFELFQKKKSKILNIYFTAGFPELDSTLKIALALEKAGVDMIEIGIPFSDPLADGPIIQQSAKRALENGMTLKVLFQQLEKLRPLITVPVLLMGYLNPVMQMGIEKFCDSCQKVGIDGVILPDLPFFEYQNYKNFFETNHLCSVFLVTPQTSQARLQQMDEIANGFLYIVSSASTTGTKKAKNHTQKPYFQKIQNAALKNPCLIGFNIKDKASFEEASKYTNGAIIGSAFIQHLEKNSSDFSASISHFVKKIKG